jgi:hypothetical protein
MLTVPGIECLLKEQLRGGAANLEPWLAYRC